MLKLSLLIQSGPLSAQSHVFRGTICTLYHGFVGCLDSPYLSCFAISIVVSVQGQDYLVNKLAEGKVLEELASRMKLIRMTAFSLICFGAGIIVSYFWKQ